VIRVIGFILVICALNVYGQCPLINVGPDMTLNCIQPCTTVTANYIPTFQTTSYTVTSIPYAPYPYTTGTLYNIPIDDRWSPVLNLPFTFCFYNQAYTQYVFSTNGIISFNLTYAGAFASWAPTITIPTAAALFPRSMIGLFHDIDPSIGGTVRYSIQGNYPCRRLVLSFSNVPHYTCNTQRSTFQIVLHEITNIIEVFVERKQTCAIWNGGRACLGIQNTAGTLAASPPGRNTATYTINTPEAWRFSPNGLPTSSFNWLNTNITNTQYTHCYDADSTLIGQVTYQSCNGTQLILRDTMNVSKQVNDFSLLGISIN
jgi:hypothetical protein